MIRRSSNLPKRLRASGATALERRLLDATAREAPPAEVRDRVARALGVSTAALGAPAAGPPPSASAASPAAGAGVGTASTSVLPWISVGVLGVVIAGAIVGTRAWMASAHQAPAVSPAVIVPAPGAPAPTLPVSAAPAMATMPPADTEPKSGEIIARPTHRVRAATTAMDLQEQTSLVDAARAALASGAADRALEILRRYRDKYPAGLFRPETAALKIEALVKLGRSAEARALAERFMAEQEGTPLANRVARLTGLARP